MTRADRARHATRAAIAALAIPTALLAVAAPAWGTVQETGESDALTLDWEGTATGTAVVTDSFVGMPVAVPGDTASRTLVVRNDGPTEGTLRASIVDVTLRDPEASDHGNFYQDLTLHWQSGDSTGGASFFDLAAAGTTAIGEVALDRGESTEITVSYEFPVEATSGNRANVGPRQAAFDVRLELSGDVSGDNPDPPTDGADLPATGVSAATLFAAFLAAAVGAGLAGIARAATARREPARAVPTRREC